MPAAVQLFVTCIVDTVYPKTGESVVNVLRRLGVPVDFPTAQTCCGQPAFNAGMRTQARTMAKHTLRVFETALGMVVVPSGSCTAMVRHGFLELFAGDPVWEPRARALAERTFEFTEFLVDVLGVEDLGAAYPGKLTYHPSCHLSRDLGVNSQPCKLLASVRHSQLAALPYSDECCGFGGLFAIEHPELSHAMLERKIANIEASGAQVVVSCDGGCIANMNGMLHRRGMAQRAVHIAEILDSG